jgi:cell division protein FtsL
MSLKPFKQKLPLIKMSNVLIMLSFCTITAIFFLKIKNNCINLNESNITLKKKLTFYENELQNLASNVTSLKRSDRIRIVAENELGMYYPEPESLDVIITN